MQALQQLAGPARMLIVGDSKLVSYTDLATTIDQKVTFIAPASKTYVSASVLAAQDLGQTGEVGLRRGPRRRRTGPAPRSLARA